MLEYDGRCTRCKVCTVDVEDKSMDIGLGIAKWNPLPLRGLKRRMARGVGS